jgi:hypothetical protein
MRSGGTNVGIGGSGASYFYNPAGLSTMNRDSGGETKILNVTSSINKNLIDSGTDFISDIEEVDDEDERNIETIKLAKEHLGENNHLGISDFTYFANHKFILGALGSLNANFETHRGFGTEGFASIDGLVLGGAVFGGAYNYDDKIALGLGIKYFTYSSVDRDFTLRELVANSDDIENYVFDEVAESGESIVFDLGLLYHFGNSREYHLGVSGINIGGIGKESHSTYIPETLNIGAGYSKKIEKRFLHSLKFGIDYTDLTEEYEESDNVKKIRAGIDLSIVDSSWITFKIGAGLYQGYPTAGLNFRVALLDFAFTTYAEEIGVYSGQEEDRRYMANFTFGW